MQRVYLGEGAGLVVHDGHGVRWLGGDRIHGLGAPREHIGPLNEPEETY